MSRENVELVRGLQPSPDVDLTELFYRGDDDGARAAQEAIAPLFADDFVCVFHGVSQVERRGIEGLRAAWLDWLAPWESYHAHIEELIDADDKVIVLSRDLGRRPDLDQPVELVGTAVYTLRDGKLTRIEYFTRRDEAFEVAGLPRPG
jgi:hypothetical protein